MMLPLVSIIIPVYKVEEYLDRCMESVVNQTYANLEIILVDDGSPDRCPQMCDDWAKRDSRVKVIHQQNKGLSGARNSGIREATGDWLYFLDSDDYLLLECISLMMECVDKHPDVDVVYAGAKVTKEGYEGFSFESVNLPDYSNDREWINRALLLRSILLMTAWNKLARRSFVLEKGLFFEEGYIHEDDIWNFEMAKHVSKIAVCKHDTYMYVIREGSIMTDFSKRYRNLYRLLEYFVNHITDPFRNRQISFVFEFIRVHFNGAMLDEHASEMQYIYNRMISEAKGKQKLALWMYYKGPRQFVYNYHVLGRVVNAIGKV